MGLGRVVDHDEAVPTRDVGDGADIGRVTVKMDRDNRTRPRCDGGVQPVGLERQRRLAHRGGDRDGPDQVDGQPGGHRRGGGDDHLVSVTDPVGGQRQRQRLEPVAHADAVLRTRVSRKAAFEGLDFRSQDEPAGTEHACDGGVDRVLELAVRGTHVEKGN